MERLLIKTLRESATLPTRATQGSAGYDLYADIAEEVTLHPNQRMKIPTGVAIGLEEPNVVALIYARSGLATKHGITLSNCVGVIDSDYRGEIIVGLFNSSKTAYTIKPQERIAQMVLTPIHTPPLVEVDELSDTVRGDGGFGSTSK